MTTIDKITNLINETNQVYLLDFIDYCTDRYGMNKNNLLSIYNDFSKQDDEKQPVSTEKRCVYIYKRGNKSNSICGIQVKCDGNLCSKHKKTQIKQLRLDLDIQNISDEEENDTSIDDVEEEVEDIEEVEVDDWGEVDEDEY